jgi:hypothetical protein
MQSNEPSLVLISIVTGVPSISLDDDAHRAVVVRYHDPDSAIWISGDSSGAFRAITVLHSVTGAIDLVSLDVLSHKGRVLGVLGMELQALHGYRGAEQQGCNEFGLHGFNNTTLERTLSVLGHWEKLKAEG